MISSRGCWCRCRGMRPLYYISLMTGTLRSTLAVQQVFISFHLDRCPKRFLIPLLYQDFSTFSFALLLLTLLVAWRHTEVIRSVDNVRPIPDEDAAQQHPVVLKLHWCDLLYKKMQKSTANRNYIVWTSVARRKPVRQQVSADADGPARCASSHSSRYTRKKWTLSEIN